MEAENKNLRKLLEECKTSSKAREAELQNSFDEVSAALFCLRPQRRERPQAEIERNFDELRFTIGNWTSSNCEDFLSNDYQGFDIMLNCGTNKNPGVEVILKRFQQSALDIAEFKNKILEAIVMRHLFDGILSHSWPILLSRGEQDLLTRLYEILETGDFPKGNFPSLLYIYDDANCLVARFTYEAHLET